MVGGQEAEMVTTPRKVPSLNGRRHRDTRADFAELMRALRTLVDPYRPELHYMRGPGPKWHAKHARSVPSEAPQLPGLASIKG
jgi:hypothetical protein